VRIMSAKLFQLQLYHMDAHNLYCVGGDVKPCSINYCCTVADE